MTDGTSILILRLEGVLQSWGECSKWDSRDSGDLPTKSGIVGLIACAMGIERDNNEIQRLDASMRIAVRADRAGTRYTDFQTVTGDPLMSAAGKRRSLGNTIISRREYLQDACFTVAIQASTELCRQIVSALEAPVWSVYLGRKSCVPSRPVLECADAEYPSLKEAIRKYPAAERCARPMVIEEEQGLPDAASFTRPDAATGSGRNFTMRRVWRSTIEEVGHVSEQN